MMSPINRAASSEEQLRGALIRVAVLGVEASTAQRAFREAIIEALDLGASWDETARSLSVTRRALQDWYHHQPEELASLPDGMAKVPEMPGLLTCRQVAAHLGVGEKAVRSLVHARKLRSLKIGKYLRFEPQDVARLLEESKR